MSKSKSLKHFSTTLLNSINLSQIWQCPCVKMQQVKKVLNKKIFFLSLSLSLSPEVLATCTKLKYNYIYLITIVNTLTSKIKFPQKLVGKLVFQIFHRGW